MISRQAVKEAFQDAVLLANALIGGHLEYVEAKVNKDGLAEVAIRSAGSSTTSCGITLHNLPDVIQDGQLSQKAIQAVTKALYNHHTEQRVAYMKKNNLDYNML